MESSKCLIIKGNFDFAVIDHEVETYYMDRNEALTHLLAISELSPTTPEEKEEYGKYEAKLRIFIESFNNT